MGDEGLEVLKAIVEYGFVVSDDDGPHCFYCDAEDGTPHESTCQWLVARAYLRDQGVDVEVESED